jgi:hypothetical protein
MSTLGSDHSFTHHLNFSALGSLTYPILDLIPAGEPQLVLREREEREESRVETSPNKSQPL